MAQNAAEQLAELTVRLMEWKETDKVVLLPLQTVLESADTLRYISLNLQGIHTINQSNYPKAARFQTAYGFQKSRGNGMKSPCHCLLIVLLDSKDLLNLSWAPSPDEKLIFLWEWWMQNEVGQ